MDPDSAGPFMIVHEFYEHLVCTEMDMLRDMIGELEIEHGDIKQTMDSLRTVRASWRMLCTSQLSRPR